MLTVIIEYKGKVLMMLPFVEHKEAIELYSLLVVQSHALKSVSLGLTSETEIKLGDTPPPYYVR
jgi:hypothetical protein